MHAAEEPIGGDTHHMEAYQVVSTATRTERLFSEVPIKTEMLGADDFEAAMAFELGTAIELLNGARTEANCQNCGTAEIQLLGLPGNYNQILIDGLPLFTGVASVYGIDQVPTLFVERIEVVKGGGSSLYGPGAVAGVINLIPEEPFDTHAHIDTTYRNIDGSHTYQGQFASYAVNNDGSLKASVYGLYADQDGYDANGDGFTELVQRTNTTLGTYLWWTPTDHSRLRFNYQYIQEDRRGGDRLDVPEEYAQIAEALYTDYHWATLSWSQELSPELSFAASASAVKFYRDSYYGGTGEELIQPGDPRVDPVAKTYNGAAPDASAAPGSDAARAAALFGDPPDGTGGGSFNSFGFTETTSWVFDASFAYNAGDWGNTGSHHLIMGIQSETEDLRDEQLDAAGNFIAYLHNDSFRNVGLFMQDEWKLNERLELVPGLRADKANTLSDWVISPRIAGRWAAGEQLAWRANYSSGFLAPRVFDEDIHIENIGGVPRDIVNPPDLREERSHTLALGADFTPTALDDRLVTSFQTYYTILENSFDLDEGTLRVENGREKIDRVNTSGSTVFGVEWDASYRVNRNLSLNAGLAYSRARYDEVDSDRDTRRYNKTPDWTGLLQAVYTNEQGANGFFAVKWTGSMLADRLDSVVPDVNPVEKTPEFWVVDLGVSKSFDFEHFELTVRASINNLLNQYQDDLETGPSRDPGYIYGPRYPRTWTLGARVDF
jgi:outer membrane receptor for ferrienterochelin and colicins